MTYEINLHQHEKEELKKKKDRGVDLKADVEGESDRNSESDLSDQEIAFLARRFRKYIKNKNFALKLSK